MKTFRLYNLISGWTVFGIAAIVYLMTIEPTTSFWDCGEFIATAFKQEVGHPPGAPFFMILGRFFTLFAGGNTELVALTMNVLSGLASAFTILFLFWTITHLVRKFYGYHTGYTLPQLITILGSGLVGALAYTFSDTFWFSATEAEVYATSSLITAFVFWAMLKWENIADEPHANRWIILIAYLMGISIGVHLLNLLTIPALVFIYYFKKFPYTRNGFLLSILASIVILGAIMYVVIPLIPYFASRFELMFVNGFSLPFYSGVVFFMVLLFALTIFGIYYTYRKKKVVWNTILTSFFVIIIGYSSYSIIMIRSIANTPLDESNPETIFTLKSYLNREQYGDRPLMHGAYFNAKPTSVEEGKTTYYRGEDEYFEVNKDRQYTFNPEFEGFFPRIWSSQGKHAGEYIYWANLKESDLYNMRTDQQGNPVHGRMGQVQYDRNNPKAPPTFGQNMRFFFRYQIGHMYLRYFMWNFTGRQNDLQGHGEPTKGNWISGIKFLDEARLGPQENLPDFIKNNEAHNKYYFLPLILGLVGLIFHFRKHWKDAWIVTLLFVLTGIAIVVYLNQYPLQPRERDYAYAGSFYAFAIWIGLGVTALIEGIRKRVKSVAVPVGVTVVTLLLVPVLMASENWDDHDRSDRYTAKTLAMNYLTALDDNAIIFTNGDNDTFPLWYIQEVEDFRTDVRVVNLSYLTADWYIEQMNRKYYESDPLPLSLTREQNVQGTRDFAYLVETAGALIRQKYEHNIEKYRDEVTRLYDEAKTLVDRSRLPSQFPKDYNAFTALEDSMDPMRLFSYLNTFGNQEIAERINIDRDGINALIDDMEKLVRTIDADYVPLESAMEFFASDDPRFRDGQYFIPGRKFIIPSDSTLVDEQIVPESLQQYRTDEVRFQLSEEVVYKNSLTQLDLLAHNDWERPVYFSNTVTPDNFLGLENTFIQEGLAYRIAPIKAPGTSYMGVVDTDKMYRMLMEEFQWGGIDNPDVYLNENNRRMTIKYRYSFAILGRALAEEGDEARAVEVLDHCMEHMPHERVSLNFSVVPLIQSYFAAGANEKALELVTKLERINEQELNYFRSLIRAQSPGYLKLNNDYLQSVRDLSTMSQVCMGYGETETSRRLEQKVQTYIQDYEQTFR